MSQTIRLTILAPQGVSRITESRSKTMRFPKDFLDELRARVPVSDVVSRSVRLKKQGREYVGLSPFKAEKTPSFTINDAKGFYHCFATGEHGDIFAFLMKIEGLTFNEAVEQMAERAGVDLPRQTPRDAERESERARLLAACEAAAAFFQDTLAGASPDAAAARAYLERRGVSRDAVAQFRLGVAPAQRQALRGHLRAKGFSDTELARAGLVIAGDDIDEPYDRFRSRLMFPIADLRGEVIAFGGRILDASHPAKYLNSPETPVFHKGGVLYNAHAARKPAHDADRLVVCEGYMDVVALWQAGFPYAVAPLGTALTPAQMATLWRFVDEPILCFDGDGAGKKAAHRAVETALEHLEPGRSLQFAFLPDGLDPDDLLRAQGPEALRAVLDEAQPLIDVLWQKEWVAQNRATPERRAQARATILGLAQQIRDASVQAEYMHALKERIWQDGRSREPARRDHGAGNGHGAGNAKGGAAWRPPRPRAGEGGRGGRARGPAGAPAMLTAPAAETLVSPVVAAQSDPRLQIETALVEHLSANIWLLDDELDTVAALELVHEEPKAAIQCILDKYMDDQTLDSDGEAHDFMGSQPSELSASACSASPQRDDPLCQRSNINPELARRTWALLLDDFRIDALRRSIADATRDYERNGDDAVLTEILALQAALQEACQRQADALSGDAAL